MDNDRLCDLEEEQGGLTVAEKGYEVEKGYRSAASRMDS